MALPDSSLARQVALLTLLLNRRDALTREELLDVVHRQGFEGFHQVHRCELEPNGTFYVEAFDPSAADRRHAELNARLDSLQRALAELKSGGAFGNETQAG